MDSFLFKFYLLCLLFEKFANFHTDEVSVATGCVLVIRVKKKKKPIT